MSWGYPGKLGIAPLDIDPWWLATGLIFAKTAMAQPSVLFKDHGHDPAEQQAILRQSFWLLGDIAVERGLDLAPYIDAIMRHYEEHLAVPPPKARETMAPEPNTSASDSLKRAVAQAFKRP